MGTCYLARSSETQVQLLHFNVVIAGLNAVKDLTCGFRELFFYQATNNVKIFNA